jgi:hypothetical protein
VEASLLDTMFVLVSPVVLQAHHPHLSRPHRLIQLPHHIHLPHLIRAPAVLETEFPLLHQFKQE